MLRGARYDLRKATMIDLIRAAYGVEPDLIVGGPGWLGFDRFDIAAKADPATPPATIRLMLQNLLAERFSLVLHKDTRQMPAYSLTVGKAKPALRESDGASAPECQYQRQPGGSDSRACHNMTMDAFAEQDPYPRRRLPREPGY